ncbi:MAG: M48 family metalloprotease [Holosporales bacterium]|nr:M48 family metalloprotease [Holosporales bacterium]
MSVFCVSLTVNEAAADRPGYFDDYLLMEDESETFIRKIVYLLKEVFKYDREVVVYISGSQSPNAAASQNGDIIVNAGLIFQCDDVSELIAVLAHEVGHVVGGHVTMFMSQQSDFLRAGLVTILIGAATSFAVGNPAPLVAAMAGGQGVAVSMALGKLRQKENIADTRAAEAVRKLGWWPVFSGFVSIHKKLAAHVAISNEYFSTHPCSEDRIAKYNEFARSVKDKKMTPEVAVLLEDLQKWFVRIKLKLKALILPVEDLLELYKAPKNANERCALAIALYRANKFKDAINEIDKTISSSEGGVDAAYCTEIKAMSQINLRRCDEAADTCWHVLQYDRAPNVHRDLAIIFADAVVEGKITRHIKNAIKILKKVRATHESISAIMMLGQLHTLAGNNDEASLCAAETAALIGDAEAAVHHAKKVSGNGSTSARSKAGDIVKTLDESQSSLKPRSADNYVREGVVD